MLPFVILFIDKNVRIGGLVSRSSIFHLQIRHHAESAQQKKNTSQGTQRTYLSSVLVYIPAGLIFLGG